MPERQCQWLHEEITTAYEKNEASMEEACAELRQRTEETLSELKALEKMLKRRQAGALEDLRSAGASDTSDHSASG